MDWEHGVVHPVPLDRLGQRYRRYRLADPPAEEAMAGSLRRWGQLSPVVACARGTDLELLDGFKRWSAARQASGSTSLSVRVVELDEPLAKAAILGLNRGQRAERELEEAWVVQAIVRDDGLTQVEAAQLLGQHKSWVCRRLAMLERLTTVNIVELLANREAAGSPAALALERHLGRAERRLAGALKSIAALRRLRKRVVIKQVNVANGPLVVNNRRVDPTLQSVLSEEVGTPQALPT
ncbi:MAG: ParB N-terminal domain-containing protein [Gemmataceae bacterium]